SLPGYLAKKSQFVRIFETRTETRDEELAYTDFDDIMRALVSPGGKRAGWVVRQMDTNEWVWQPKDDVKSALLALDHKRDAVDIILGRATLRGWKLVNIPFMPEY